MSLTPAEQRRTSEVLHANARLCRATAETLAGGLGLTVQQTSDTLTVNAGSRPQDVWLLRDHLQDLVLAQGGTPAPSTVLTEPARQSAAVWFPLHPRSRPSAQHVPQQTRHRTP